MGQGRLKRFADLPAGTITTLDRLSDSEASAAEGFRDAFLALASEATTLGMGPMAVSALAMALAEIIADQPMEVRRRDLAGFAELVAMYALRNAERPR